MSNIKGNNQKLDKQTISPMLERETVVGRHEISHFIVDGIEYPFSASTQAIVGQLQVVDAHYHAFIEILYCTEGSYHIILDGIGYDFSKGDMVVINSNEIHHVFSLSEQNNYIVIRFKPGLLYTTSQTIFESRYVLPFTMKTSTHQRVFFEEELLGTDIPRLLISILNEDENKKYGFELAIRTSIGEIFLWILRRWHKKGLDLNLSSGLNQDSIKRLSKVFNYVDDNYTNPIKVEEMAKLCNMSYSYFSRFFKKSMNRNFSDYVNLIRVKNAEYLLVTTDISITVIAMDVGFTTASYFIEQFKKAKGMTPKNFRNRFKQVEQTLNIT